MDGPSSTSASRRPRPRLRAWPLLWPSPRAALVVRLSRRRAQPAGRLCVGRNDIVDPRRSAIDDTRQGLRECCTRLPDAIERRELAKPLGAIEFFQISVGGGAAAWRALRSRLCLLRTCQVGEFLGLPLRLFARSLRTSSVVAAAAFELDESDSLSGSGPERDAGGPALGRRDPGEMATVTPRRRASSVIVTHHCARLRHLAA